MNLNRSFIRFSALTVAVAAAVLTVRLAGQATEPRPSIRVDSRPIDRDPKNGNSYAPMVKRVAPSVVNIYSTQFLKQRVYRNPFMADPFFRQFFGQDDPGQEVTRRADWLGCGIIVAPEGYILTANHVVDGADEIKVTVRNDKTYSARVVGKDPPTDVAILKIEAKDLPAVTLGDSDQLEVGDVVLAIGNPFGVGQTVTRGIISALGRNLSDADDPDSQQVRQYQNFIQTDAAINEGNSGGALIDTEGRLIGINDAIISPSGASAGIGFAVPINLARSIMEAFLKGGKVTRGYLGVEPQDIDAGLAREFGAPSTEGALVTNVRPNSPAARAGLLVGDDIVSINGKDITGADSLRLTVAQLPPGTQAKLKVYRNGAAKILLVTLGDLSGIDSEATEPETAKPGGGSAPAAKADAMDGVVVHDLTPRWRRQLGAQPNLTGALVTQVDRTSNSYDAGLRPGDVILEVNRRPVTTAAEASQLCHAARSELIVVKIWRPDPNGGRVRFLDVDNTKRPG